MTHKPKDLSHYFEGTDIDIEITSWKQENRDYWIFFLPLILNDAPQDALQKLGNKVSRLHFTLLEKNGKLHLADIPKNRGWYLDTTELYQGRFRLVGQTEALLFLRQAVVDLGFLDEHH